MEYLKKLLTNHNLTFIIKNTEFDDGQKRCHLDILESMRSLVYIICNVFVDYIYTYDENHEVINKKKNGKSIYFTFFYSSRNYILSTIELNILYWLLTIYKEDVNHITLEFMNVTTFIDEPTIPCFLCTCHQLGFRYTKNIPKEIHDGMDVCILCYSKDYVNLKPYFKHYKMHSTMTEIYPLLCNR